jgi:ABC-2 type transport system permease protein
VSVTAGEAPVQAAPADGGRVVDGPTAAGGDLRRLWRLSWTLAVTDFKLKFFGSVLGYLWQLMRPLLLFGVLYLVFSQILAIGAELPRYPLALLLGVVIFQFFSEGTSGAVRAVLSREGLIRRVDFPRLAIPLATVLTALMNLGLNLIPVLIFMLIAGDPVSVGWLQIPVVLAFIAAFVFGLAMLLSALFIRFRDVEPIWDVILQALFYATPILYSVQIVIEKAGIETARVMLANPLATAIQQVRHAAVDPAYLSAGQVYGSRVYLLIPIGITLVTILVGWLVFRREAPHMAEDL